MDTIKLYRNIHTDPRQREEPGSIVYYCTSPVSCDSPVADPGFPRGGGANPKGGQPIIWPILPENCMKMKKFWAGGGACVPRAPLRSATAVLVMFPCSVNKPLVWIDQALEYRVHAECYIDSLNTVHRQR